MRATSTLLSNHKKYVRTTGNGESCRKTKGQLEFSLATKAIFFLCTPCQAPCFRASPSWGGRMNACDMLIYQTGSQEHCSARPPLLAPSRRGGVFPDASFVEALGLPCSVLTGGDAFRRHDAPDRRIGPDRTSWFANDRHTLLSQQTSH